MRFPQATYRFYGDLIDLLTLPDESGLVTRTFDESPSVKDQIEACGVPHTEVDLILVNGVSEAFSYRVADGDRISVYPFTSELGVEHVSRVRPEPLRNGSFVVDINLGKLARHLRVLGFDTVIDGNAHDADLVDISVSQRRMLLTKDRALLKRAAVTHGYLVRSLQPEAQIIEVVRRFDLAQSMEPFGRCLECNGLIEPVAKTEIEHRLEPLTKRYFDDFRRCRDCDRIFWRGSHFARLEALVKRVRVEVG